jgi:hypothetical protein
MKSLSGRRPTLVSIAFEAAAGQTLKMREFKTKAKSRKELGLAEGVGSEMIAIATIMDRPDLMKFL